MTASHFTPPFTTFSRRLSCPGFQCSVRPVSAGTLLLLTATEVSGQVHAPAALTSVTYEQGAGCEPEASRCCAEEKPLCPCRELNPDSQMAQYVMWPLYRLWYNVSGDIYILTKILYVILVSPSHSPRSHHVPDYRTQQCLAIGGRSSWA
jgi:hypothetical protein